MDTIFLALIGWALIITWIVQLVRLSKKQDKTAFWVFLILGILFWFLMWIWVFVMLFIGRGKDKETERHDNDTERERERESKTFFCGICYGKYSVDFFGGETIKEGKICRFCLRKKQEGEKIN